MSSSAPPPAPASSPSETYKFPESATYKLLEGLVGSQVSLSLLYREANMVEARGDKNLTTLKLDAHGVPLGKSFFLETIGGLKMRGIIELDDDCKPSISVKHGEVWSCLCCTNMVVSTRLLSSIEEKTVRFSESDPQPIEATILQVQRRSNLSVVHLQLTSLPSYTAGIGDIVMLRFGMITWKATVIYFGDHSTKLDEVCGVTENTIYIHVLDEHAPQGPKLWPQLPQPPQPHMEILVRPAPGVPYHMTIRLGKKSQKKHKYGKNEANKNKINVAIHGYRDIGRSLARVALDSDDVDLVAINDTSITESCMFRDLRCDFEVKSSNPGILSFGKKEVNFFKESDPSAVPWYMASTDLVVTSIKSSQTDEDSCKAFAAKYCQLSDVKLSGPLENILSTCNSPSSTPNNWRFPVLHIQPITSRDAKAVSECFPLWKGKRVVSAVRFQGVDMVFDLGEYPEYESLPNSTEASIDFSQLVRWCFHMLSRSQAAICDVEFSKRPGRQAAGFLFST